MELKPGYKQTEVGIIPEDWEVLNLGHICSKVQDGNYGEAYPKPHEFLNYGIPFLTSKAIGKDGLLKTNLINYISQEKHDLLNKAHIKLNDVLFTNRGASVGAIGFVDERIEGGNIGPQLTLLRSDPDFTIPHYLLQQMKSDTVQKQIHNQDSGSAMNFFGNLATQKFLILLPPNKKEQHAIATALSDVDALLNSLDRLIAKKRDIKKAAMQQLLTGETRLPGFEKKQGYKKTELGVIPKDWKIINLSEIGETLAGLTYSPKDVAEHGLLVLRSSNIQNGKLAFDDNVYVKMNVPNRVITKAGDILICVRNGSRQLIGKCALISQSAEGTAFGAFMSVFRSKSNGFVFFQFQSVVIQRQIRERMGATINQITNKDMAEFIIPIPSKFKEQTAIATILSDMDAEITALEKRHQKTQHLKQAMMQELLTGKTRLVTPGGYDV
ncbi:restriction endonuclease subunit S [Desulfococcaceae bacterium HSG9]|nr:restriction endonuclease subunit S [Desulfococcaceae bacterium HSG9]